MSPLGHSLAEFGMKAIRLFQPVQPVISRIQSRSYCRHKDRQCTTSAGDSHQHICIDAQRLEDLAKVS